VSLGLPTIYHELLHLCTVLFGLGSLFGSFALICCTLCPSNTNDTVPCVFQKKMSYAVQDSYTHGLLGEDSRIFWGLYVLFIQLTRYHRMKKSSINRIHYFDLHYTDDTYMSANKYDTTI
jgi:hypothetical protein